MGDAHVISGGICGYRYPPGKTFDWTRIYEFSHIDFYNPM